MIRESVFLLVFSAVAKDVFCIHLGRRKLAQASVEMLKQAPL